MLYSHLSAILDSFKDFRAFPNNNSVLSVLSLVLLVLYACCTCAVSVYRLFLYCFKFFSQYFDEYGQQSEVRGIVWVKEG